MICKIAYNKERDKIYIYRYSIAGDYHVQGPNSDLGA